MPKYNFLRLPTNVLLNISPTTGTDPNLMRKDTSKVKSLFHQYLTTSIRWARQDNQLDRIAKMETIIMKMFLNMKFVTFYSFRCEFRGILNNEFIFSMFEILKYYCVFSATRI
ncbi:hypothetical protein EDEG_01699 [Edhazardia aedis USNM 41457]|uniref:Uncharacterized protein n=1 Tax=Edhazardia aedis (strain USNM 41457) TaxID=1003232 RepID=J9DN93_EDHAE|nr:hypothetical protein EDEG_01699 [Edhazardia aedis USNM 41457]|eukprot:EJW04005.1 hypothetical protein EDEG_01699 [Edhazardia aedis USNM 41457]